MKTTLSSLLLGAAFCVAAAKAQNVGDTVTPEALGQAEWVQGSAPKEWEPGKLYILECWATWCGPCIANIPHVDALYDKFFDQGLRVIGVDVWEDGKDKVADFVKKKGDGMSYPVAYVGKGGAFETKWLKPAEVQGIPHAFLVKDGKVLAMTHPAGLTDELVTTLLKGGVEQDEILAKLNAGAARMKEIGKAKGAWQAAYDKKDAVAMAAAVKLFEAADPGYIYLTAMRNDTLVAARDWAGIDKFIAEDSGQLHHINLSSLATTLIRSGGDEVPAGTISKLTAAYEADIANGKQKSPMDAVTLSRLAWKAGDKDKAAARAKDGVEWAAAPAPDYAKMPVAPFEKFSAAVAGGSMPTDVEFVGWVKEAKAAEAPAAGK